MKQYNLVDERGLPWVIIEGDEFYDRLKKVKLVPEEYACFRDQLFMGLGYEDNLSEAQERLQEITKRALSTIKPDDSLLQEFIHAAKAVTLLDTLHVDST